MIQYNLRLDEKTKQKASSLAKNRGISENSFYQMAIEDFLSKTEAADFFEKLMRRIVSSDEKKKILQKLKKHSGEVLYREDQ